MSNELTVGGGAFALPAGIQENKFVDPKSTALVTSGGDWLPRIQVGGATSEAVKTGKLPMGHFGLFEGQAIIDLGQEFNCYVLQYRPKAMSFAPEVISVYDPTNAEFKKIIDRCEAGGQAQAAYGPEFLLWLDKLKKYATFFMGNKSGRMEGPSVMAFLPKPEEKIMPATFRVAYIKGKGKNSQNSWHAASVNKCNLEVDAPTDQAEMLEKINKFNTPPATTVETTEADTRAR